MAVNNRPKMVIGPREEDMIERNIISKMSYGTKESIARSSHSNNYYAGYDNTGIPIPEDMLNEAILGLAIRGVSEGGMGLDANPEAFSKWYYEDKLPAIKESNQRSVEWIIRRMETENPELIEELQERGCNFSYTEYKGTSSFASGTVEFMFRDSDGNPLMVLYYNPSDMNYEAMWF